ncbi:tRNA (guanine-N(7)-)-methyltransferase (tRNA(m7G46)-methyltransferase) [Lecanora helva]
MSLKARDVFLAAFIAFVAWGYLTSWAPILRFLGYAFITGIFLTLFAFVAFVFLSAKDGESIAGNGRDRPQSVAFLTPQAWKAETEWLSSKSIYRRTPLYPESFMISDALDDLLDLILRDYVNSWYSKISPSPNFANEIERAVRTALINVRDEALALDLVEVAVSRVVPLITAHLKDFYEAERAVRGKNLNRNVTESEELDLAIAGKYREGNLHPAASLAYSDLKVVQQEYIRRILVRLLPKVLPESMIKSRAVSVLTKEIVSCAVLAPLMQMLSDPDTWNQLMEAYGQTTLQDRKSVRKLRAALDQHASPAPKAAKPHTFPRIAPGDDERRFERFIRSIRQCHNLSEARRFRSEVASQLKRESMTEGQDPIFLRRLETGKYLLDQRVAKLSAVGGTPSSQSFQAAPGNSQNKANLLNATIIDVLHDATGLSYFMEYMDRQRLMVFVQFWIVVDGFRNPLEADVQTNDPFSGNQERWTESDRADIEQMNEAYLSRPELNVREEAKETVRVFLKAGPHATMSQYLRARSVILRTQSGVLQVMEDVYFPNFKKSDLYYKYLTSDDGSSKTSSRTQAKPLKQPSVAPILESPSRPPPLSRVNSRMNAGQSDLRRAAVSNTDLKAAAKVAEDAAIPRARRSFDIDTSAPLFNDGVDDEKMSRSIQSLDNESINGDEGVGNQEQMVEAMEAVLNNIMTDDAKEEETQDSIFKDSEPDLLSTKTTESSLKYDELKSAEFLSSEKEREKPNLASLGLVNTSSRIGVFSDNDLFGDEEKFLEDEQTDPEVSADEKSMDEEIHQAAPGDLGLAEAITALTADIDRLASQESVVDTLTRKAELTNNVAELRILGKSKSSLQRETRRKELQRQQYIVQESDNSLYGKANVHIKSIMVGKEDDGQEFALYVIEVQRKAGDNMPAASWAVARRYSEFHHLHQRLRNFYPAVRNLDFPRRRLVMKLQRDFLHKRRVSLQNYLRELLRLPAVCRSHDLRAFLSQSAIISTNDSTRDGERRDIISRIYNSVTDGMDEFLGNVPVLDQLSIAGQNLISAATSQFNTMPSAGSGGPLPIAPEDPIQTAEARAELLAFEPNTTNTSRADQLEPFVKPICDVFLEAFDLQRGNNWLRGRAVVVVLHQLLGGTVERKVREMARSFFAESSVLKYVGLLKDTMWPNGEMRKAQIVRTDAEKKRSSIEASVMLATLIPDVAGNVVGKANAQAASRRIFATVNNRRLNAHLAFTILDEILDALFPRGATQQK